MIKISSLKSVLHESNEFSIDNKEFIDSIAKELKIPIVNSDLNDYDCDLKLIFIASGGSEGLFLNNFDKLQPPYYILTSGKNNSLAASLEILTYLNNHNLDGEVLHGEGKYIAKRIKELLKEKNNKDEVDKLGVIGVPSDWLIASVPSYNLAKTYNVKLVDISLDEVITLYNQLEIDNKYNVDYFDNDEINKADKFYLALKEIIKKYDLKGLTIRCFDLLTKIKMTGCLALAKLNSEGIIATCEGDIMAMLSMYLVKKWFNQSSFQANPARIDVENKKIVLCHCTLPLDMVDSFKYTTHFESKIGVAIKGELERRSVTIFRLSSDFKNYYVAEGEILSNLNDANLCRTQIEVKLDESPKILLKKPCGNHHIVFYGRHKDEIIKYLGK